MMTILLLVLFLFPITRGGNSLLWHRGGKVFFVLSIFLFCVLLGEPAGVCFVTAVNNGDSNLVYIILYLIAYIVYAPRIGIKLVFLNVLTTRSKMKIYTPSFVFLNLYSKSF